jgi:hypothetical protein
MTDGGRPERLGNLLWIAFGLAVVPNTLNSFGVAPEGDWWTVIRAALSTFFVVVLVAYVAARLGERRRGRRARRGGQR